MSIYKLHLRPSPEMPDDYRSITAPIHMDSESFILDSMCRTLCKRELPGKEAFLVWPMADQLHAQVLVHKVFYNQTLGSDERVRDTDVS